MPTNSLILTIVIPDATKKREQKLIETLAHLRRLMEKELEVNISFSLEATQYPTLIEKELAPKQLCFTC
jgi:ribosomal protein S16